MKIIISDTSRSTIILPWTHVQHIPSKMMKTTWSWETKIYHMGQLTDWGSANCKGNAIKIAFINLHVSMKIIISETSRSTIWAGPKTGEVWIARESRSRLPLGNLHVWMKINILQFSQAPFFTESRNQKEHNAHPDDKHRFRRKYKKIPRRGRRTRNQEWLETPFRVFSKVGRRRHETQTQAATPAPATSAFFPLFARYLLMQRIETWPEQKAEL